MNTLNTIGWALLFAGWATYLIPFNNYRTLFIIQVTLFGLATLIFIANLFYPC
jgi:hypothetical protein